MRLLGLRCWPILRQWLGDVSVVARRPSIGAMAVAYGPSCVRPADRAAYARITQARASGSGPAPGTPGKQPMGDGTPGAVSKVGRQPGSPRPASQSGAVPSTFLRAAPTFPFAATVAARGVGDVNRRSSRVTLCYERGVGESAAGVVGLGAAPETALAI
jgi:hypothetical protein